MGAVVRTVFRTIVKKGATLLAGEVGAPACALYFYYQDKMDELDKASLEKLREQYYCEHLQLLPTSTGMDGVRAYVAAHNGCAFSLRGTWFWHPDPKFRIVQADDFMCRYVQHQTVDAFQRNRDNLPGQIRRSCALCSEYYKKNK